ncbi:hypothetical protein MATL_G00178480 [Megalops atlanticus]|uniref:Centrosomal P4.1-associated protein n=1 Tax=Megalops atlanticus TaxID=7932 RepID=A0A9D3PP98_MEGAT|nr:hypothetical protein MATL_G00178480 [Megalops atlanticus]
MSSPAGVQTSEMNFLAQWMPCRSRAGVILNPSLGLGSSLRESCSWAPQDADDSFSAQFAPLPVSRSSSCLSVDSLAPTEAGTARKKPEQLSEREIVIDNASPRSEFGAVMQGLIGEMDSIEETDRQSTGDLMLKLEQLKEWQKHMQEKLKAQQMEQLQQLLEEQQRLMGLVQVAQQASADHTGTSQLTEGDSGDDTVLEGPPVSQREMRLSLPGVSDLHGLPAPQRDFPRPPQRSVSPLQWAHSALTEPAPCLQRAAAHLHPHPEEEEGEDSDRTLGEREWSQDWSGGQLKDDSRADNEEEESLSALTPTKKGSSHTADREGEELQNLQDSRPIRPGIGGKSRTFEELLEEQLRLEEQRLNTSLQKQNPATTEGVKANPKRPFLKRGEGLSRFAGGKAAPPRRGSKGSPKAAPKTSIHWAPESSSNTEKITSGRRPPVQRKTAVLNKENCPERLTAPPDRSNKSETKVGPAPQPRVLGSHQRQNVAVSNPARPKSEPKQQQQRQEVPPPAKSQDAPAGRLAGRGAETMGPPSPMVLVGAEEGSRGPQPGLGKARVAGGQEHSFELSFQDKLARWEMERQREKVELGEFELLEQAAEEMSFSSNSSFVMKVLELDQQDRRGRHHHRRLSSTPIKSPKPSPPKNAQVGVEPHDKEGSSRSVSAAIVIDAEDVRPEVEDQEIEVKSDLGSEESEDLEDTDQEQEALKYEVAVPSGLCFSSTEPRYDKTSYQDEDESSVQGDGREEAGDAGGFEDHNDSTLVEGKGQEAEGRLMFDDDDTWNDLEDDGHLEDGCDKGRAITHDPLGTASDTTAPNRDLKRKVATAKGPENGPRGDVADHGLEPPPTSQLVAKLFPSLKPKAKPPPPTAPGPAGSAPEPATGTHPQSKLLRERLAELEIEIERFRSENAALASQRQEREKALEALRKERAEFERKKVEELAKLEEFKKEETRKLQKERKLFERHASAARAIPDKKEREEIQSLKQQLSSLQEELRRREARWSSTHSRLRQQLEALGAENSALREEVKALERLRLTAWKREEAEREKEREGSRRPDGNAAHGTARSKSTSPPSTARTSLPLTASAKETPRETSPPNRGSSSWKPQPPVPTPVSGTKEWAVPHFAQPITAQNPKSPPTLAPRAGVMQTELHRVEEEEDSSKEITHPDGKVERVLRSGARLIVFPNGTCKEVSADGRTVKVTFFNGDVKQVMEDQRVIYYYADAQTTHTTYPDGMEVLQFPNSQIEKHFPDGRKEITFPDQTVKNLHPDGEEESVFPDGTIIRVKPDGTKVIQFNTGQREVHTAEFKRREYPDGTVKTVYSDGRQETRYPTGRLRIKDKDGRVVMDAKT